MTIGTALVVIVALLCFTLMYLARHHTGRESRRSRSPEHIEADAIAERREIEELRERLKVLERITVDGREAKAIADEIETLRDR